MHDGWMDGWMDGWIYIWTENYFSLVFLSHNSNHGWRLAIHTTFQWVGRLLDSCGTKYPGVLRAVLKYCIKMQNFGIFFG
jgi:hypothetical protein